VAGGRILNIRYIKAGNNVYDPFNLPRLAEIELSDPAVGNRGVKHFRFKGMRWKEIGSIFRFTGYFVKRIDSIR